uniref:Uncharacterized protein n=1 Tax=Arundo donax TaxID=35708 RepID=A0A0A9GKI5_ARUDO
MLHNISLPIKRGKGNSKLRTTLYQANMLFVRSNQNVIPIYKIYKNPALKLTRLLSNLRTQ